MINAVLLLIAFQLIGEGIAQALRLPVPGMVIGLLGLLTLFILRGRRLGADRAVPPGLEAVARMLHGTLGLLFVPAGVGVLAQADLIAAEGFAIVGAVALSTLAAIGVAGRLASRREAVARARPAEPAR
jgi:putative effector of murein hydrolase LrgA (UPF0299 family)